MATANDLSMLVRADKEINDMEKIRYSDYEMLVAINSILRTMNNVLVTTISDIVEKTTTITLTNGVGDMPADWVTTIQVYANSLVLEYLPPPYDLVEGYYRISGSRIYSSHTSVNLVYSATFPSITQMTDNLPLPNIFLDMLVDYIKLILKGSQPKTQDIITALDTTNVRSIMARRKVSGVEVPMPYIT